MKGRSEGVGAETGVWIHGWGDPLQGPGPGAGVGVGGAW